MPFAADYLRQDAIAMNLQRICELTIDIANHVEVIEHHRRESLDFADGALNAAG